MIKEIREIRNDFNLSIAGVSELNERVNDDIKFAYVPGEQWQTSSYEKKFENRPKPENNQVGKAIRRLLGQYERLELNAVIMSNSDDATDEDAELLMSRWRNDFRSGQGIEALNNAASESFAGGFGAFKVVAKYEDEEAPSNENQYLCVESIYSAASSVVFNAGAIRKDKSDATQCWQLVRVNRKETEEEFDVKLTPFPDATSDNAFDWGCLDSNKDIYIAHYWEVRKVKVAVFNFNDGELIIERKARKYYDQNGQRIDKEDFNAIKETTEYTETQKTVKEVWYSLIDGTQHLIKPRRTPFKRVPVIPQYGYHHVINGVEFYCGEVAGSRDPQMFENMYYASLMEIMGQRQVAIDEYAPEQVENGLAQKIADEQKNNSAIRITQPILDQAGNIAHIGPVNRVQPPDVGSGLVAAGQYLQSAQQQQNGTGQSTLPSNAAADAVRQINERQDDTFQPLYQNAMQAIKALCRCWIDAAQEIYFSNQRKLRVMSEDGSYSQVTTLEYGTINGEYGPYKNTARGKYDVTVKAGESHKTKKEADRQAALEILQYADTSTPIGQMALNTAIMSTTGTGTQSIRKMARFQEIETLMSMGIDPNAKTDEEKEFMQRVMQKMQQPQQPDAMTIAAMAEQTKADSDMLDSQVKAFEAETRRAKVQVDAQKAGADIALKTAQTSGTELDNVIKMMDGNQ